MSRLSYLTRSSRFSWPYAFNVSRVANKCERKMKRQFISDYKWRRRNLSSAKLISHDARVLRSWLLDLCDVRIKNLIESCDYIREIDDTDRSFLLRTCHKCEGKCRRKFSCEGILKKMNCKTDLFIKGLEMFR